MGFLSKAFKGIKKVVKSVGKSIKKVVTKVAKAYNKLGIVGQIGLMFVLPGIGETLAGWGQAMSASSNAFVSFAGKTLSSAVNFVGQAGNAFSKVTDGVTNFLGDFAASTAKSLGMTGEWAMNAPGFSESFAKLGQSFSEAGTSLTRGLTGNTTGNAWFGKTASEVAAEGVLNQGTLPDSGAKLGDLSSGSLTAPTEGVAATAKSSFLSDAGVLVDPTTGAMASAAPVVDPITGAISNPVTATSSKATQSLLASASTVPEATWYEKGYDKLKDWTVEGAQKGVVSATTSAVRQATGVEKDPVYNQTSYATYVPEVSGAESIQDTSGPFDFSKYMVDNRDYINSNPYGFNAKAIFEDNVYRRTMATRGFAV